MVPSLMSFLEASNALLTEKKFKTAQLYTQRNSCISFLHFLHRGYPILKIIIMYPSSKRIGPGKDILKSDVGKVISSIFPKRSFPNQERGRGGGRGEGGGLLNLKTLKPASKTEVSKVHEPDPHHVHPEASISKKGPWASSPLAHLFQYSTPQ